jgi:hypothetical protein
MKIQSDESYRWLNSVKDILNNTAWFPLSILEPRRYNYEKYPLTNKASAGRSIYNRLEWKITGLKQWKTILFV